MGPAMFFNRRILEEAHQKIAELAPLGITAFAFTPTNGWVIVTQTGAFFARNIPQECFDKLGELIAAGVTINCVAFPPAGGNSWVITGNGGFFCRNAPQECADKIAQFYLAGQPVIDVAFPPGGGNSWTVAARPPSTYFLRTRVGSSGGDPPSPSTPAPGSTPTPAAASAGTAQALPCRPCLMSLMDSATPRESS